MALQLIDGYLLHVDTVEGVDAEDFFGSVHRCDCVCCSVLLL
jgi:hypothetical protein